MKAIMIGTQVSAAAAFIAAFFFAMAAVQAEDLNAVYQQGRAAFYRGDMATAQQLLSQVAAANPRHADTQRMLAFIRANHKPAENTLKNQYATVILPKVEMADVSLTEAVEALRALSKNASGGKVIPNVIVKGEELAQRKLTLNVSNIPLTEALTYVTQLVDAKATYDKHAVILSSQADTIGSTAAAK